MSIFKKSQHFLLSESCQTLLAIVDVMKDGAMFLVTLLYIRGWLRFRFLFLVASPLCYIFITDVYYKTHLVCPISFAPVVEHHHILAFRTSYGAKAVRQTKKESYRNKAR